MKTVMLILFFLLLLLSGCTHGSQDAEQIEATIRRYDQLLTEGYANLNMNPLQEVATSDQAQKDYFHMAALGEGRVRMLAKLTDISFSSVDFPKKGEATITTHETWDFAYVDIKSGKKESEVKGFVYQLRYELKKEGKRWIIRNVTALNNDEKAVPPSRRIIPSKDPRRP